MRWCVAVIVLFAACRGRDPKDTKLGYWVDVTCRSLELELKRAADTTREYLRMRADPSVPARKLEYKRMDLPYGADFESRGKATLQVQKQLLFCTSVRSTEDAQRDKQQTQISFDLQTLRESDDYAAQAAALDRLSSLMNEANSVPLRSD